MSRTLARNTIANFVGQGWGTLMGVVFVPVYIDYLGMEAFGVIGFFVAMQGWLAVLDLGFTPLLNREMARYGAGQHTADGIKTLLRTMEAAMAVMAVLVALGFVVAAPFIVGSWLKLEALDASALRSVVVLVGLVTALRLLESLYRASLVGLERQVSFNVIAAVLGTVRAVGVLAIFAAGYADLTSFFLWQVAVSVVTVVVLGVATYRALPRAAGRIAPTVLAPLRRFAGGMAAITLLSVLLMNVDKLLLSGLLPLAVFGEYSLATAVASALFLLVTPIAQSWYPRMSQLHAVGDEAQLESVFHTGARLVSVLVGSAAIFLMAFAEPLLSVWTGDAALAARVAPVLALLAVGNLLNALMWLPYHVQLAYGWTDLTVRLNIGAVLFVIPGLIIVTPRYGAVGAALVWASLNAFYVLVGARFMFRRILRSAQGGWYRDDLLRVLGVGAVVGGALALGLPTIASADDRLVGLVKLTVAGVAILTPMALVAGVIPRRFVGRFGT
jgi:O-antigen/teichoic acid export membrane protein